MPCPERKVDWTQSLRRAAGCILRFAGDIYRYFMFSRRFSHSRGMFETFGHAIAAAPRDKPIGYDIEALAEDYAKNVDLDLADYDFPFMYHLRKILAEGKRPCTVLDFGGNVGIHYMKYHRHLALADVAWVVCDLPGIAKYGAEVCKPFSAVRFVTDIAQAGPVDVVLAICSVQYVEGAPGLLRRANCNPEHILIGQVLLHEGKCFVTLQNGGRVYYPQYVFNRTEFIATFTAAGYTLADTWADTSNVCVLPFHSDIKISSRGFHFVRSDAPS